MTDTPEPGLPYCSREKHHITHSSWASLLAPQPMGHLQGGSEVHSSVHFQGQRDLRLNNAWTLALGGKGLARRENQDKRQPEPTGTVQVQHPRKGWGSERKVACPPKLTKHSHGSHLLPGCTSLKCFFPQPAPIPNFICSRWPSNKSRSRSCKKLKGKKKRQ